MMDGGGFLTQGGYGCVFLPGIDCDGSSLTSKKYVSKIQAFNKSAKNDCKGTGAFCIYSDSEQTCKLHIPKENLQHNKDNEEIYYIRLSDELIRYIHYQQYILNINNNNINR